MLKARVIPCLLLNGTGFYKTTRFDKPVYVGDPINILRIFNEKEVDEICILDIGASRRGMGPNISFLRDLASECFMPLSYGGGITSINQMKELCYAGFEKVVINTAAMEQPKLLEEAAAMLGSQSVVVSIDAKKKFLGGYEVMTRSGMKKTGRDPVQHAKMAEQLGSGEILINSIDRDGTMQGYDLDLISMVSNSVRVPVVACGGAGRVGDFAAAVKRGGASAVAAGAMFVFHGPHRAVLVNVPAPHELEAALA